MMMTQRSRGAAVRTLARPALPSRRDALIGFGALAAAVAAGRRPAGAAPLAELALYGPPAGPSITLAHAVAARMLAGIADKATFKAWRNPDEMRAGLTSGTMPLVIMPTTTAANLHTRGLGVRLVNVMTNGLLYVVSPDPAATSFAALAGRRLAVPFRNDTPEFVLNRLLRAEGLAAGKDLVVDTTGSPIEAIQLVLAGRMDAALVPEPAASAAILRAKAAGKTVHRVIDVQREWARIAGAGATLPQAGLAVTDAFLAANRPLVEELHRILGKAAERVVAEPARAAGNAASALDLPWPVIEASIPHSNLVAIAASAARPQLEAMFQTVADADPAIIGGRLPDAGFYL